MTNEKGIKYFSTFSGIGGFELGIERACNSYANEERPSKEGPKGGDVKRQGHNSMASDGVSAPARRNMRNADRSAKRQPACVGFSEIDKYAAQIYQHHFPDHTNYGDITAINADALPDFDLYVGGFPCQAFSIAGKRLGFADTRGTLFFDVARILKAKQPKHFLLENVKGLLSHDSGRTFKTIIATLVELGYGVEWQVLNSKDFGVPQNRERIFIVGHLGGECAHQVFPLGQGDDGDIAPLQGRFSLRGRGKNASGCLDTRGVNAFDRPDLDKLIYNYEKPKIRRLTPIECERLQGFPDVAKSSIIELSKLANVTTAKKSLPTSDTDSASVAPAAVLISCGEDGVEIHNQGKCLLNARGAERQNWSHPSISLEDFVHLAVGINTIAERIANSGRVELLPNGQCSTHPVNGLPLVRLFGNETTPPASDAKSVSTILNELSRHTTSNHLPQAKDALTQAISCFYAILATSGFIPAGTHNHNTWQLDTKVGWTYGVSDTQRYKTLGNAVTVNVIEAVISALLADDESRPCKQHRDDGRGRCIDCDNFI